MGIFDSCQKKDQTNARNLEKLAEYATAIGEKFYLAGATEEEFFRVSKDVALLDKSKIKLSKPKMRIGKRVIVPSIPREYSRHA